MKCLIALIALLPYLVVPLKVLDEGMASTADACQYKVALLLLSFHVALIAFFNVLE